MKLSQRLIEYHKKKADAKEQGKLTEELDSCLMSETLELIYNNDLVQVSKAKRGRPKKLFPACDEYIKACQNIAQAENY